MLDANGYPSEEALQAIRDYDLVTQPLSDFLTLVKENWWAADWGWKDRKWRATIVVGDDMDSGHGLVFEGDLTLHTGGWSGNEDVIEALHHNFIFWAQCLILQRHGGHYYFNIHRFRERQESWAHD